MAESDRVRVPTNGHRPALEASDDAAAPTGAADAGPPRDPTARTDLRVAFTPGQVAAGFGILAGLILLILGSRRRGTGPDRDR